jgi:hypothetical protein
VRTPSRRVSKRSCVAVRPFVLLALLLAGCAQHGTTLPDPIQANECSATSSRESAVFLVGDAGAPSLPGPGEDSALLVDPVLRSLRSDVDRALASLPRSRVAVVYLGDNVYQHGLPAGEAEEHGLTPEGHAERARGEAVLNAQIRAASDADLYFVLGNHDWNKADPVDVPGLERAQEQGRYIAAHDSRAQVVPPPGCAGPTAVNFGVDLRFVFVDAMGWALMTNVPEAVPAECPQRTTDEMAAAVKRELSNPEHRRIIFAMHHPLRTAGPHGGHYTWKQHIFPLTDFWPNAWVPLPVIGSAYPISRQLGVTNTDLSHKSYRRMVKFLLGLEGPDAPALWTAGHEHSLQVHRDKKGSLHAVSGAGSVVKVDRVEDMEGLLMGVAAPGYMRLDEYGDQTLRLSVTALDEEQNPREIYQVCEPVRQK